MANDLTVNPMQIDTAGATSAVTSAVWVQGFACHASDNTWACVIHDAAAGNVLWSTENALAACEHRSDCIMFPEPIHTTLYVTTMEDVDLVLVYLATGPH